MEAERINLIGNSLEDLPPARPIYGGIFDFDATAERLRTVNASLEDPSVWNDLKKAQELGKERNRSMPSCSRSTSSPMSWPTTPNCSR